MLISNFGSLSAPAFEDALGAAKKKAVVKAAPKAAAPSAVQKANVKRLQAALVALGKVTGSAKLKVNVDGAIGPKTVAAVNWAFTNHIGPGQAAAQYRTGALPQAYVLNNASALAALVETEVRRRQTPAAKAATASAAAVAPSPAVQKANVKRLQTALVTLGKVVGSAQLKAIKIDGAIGAKTVAAVNWAFTKHLGSGQAAAQYRTGNLPQSYVLNNANTLSAMLEAEIKRRGSQAPSTATAKQAELVKEIKATPVPITKQIAKRLQTAIVNLGKVAGSATLKAVKIDGAVGAKTVEAVNWTFTKHIGSGQAPAAFRTGNLSLDTVKAYAGELARLIETEITRRSTAKAAPAGKRVVKSSTITAPNGKKMTIKEVEDQATGDTTFEAVDVATGKTAVGDNPAEAAARAAQAAEAATASGEVEEEDMPAQAPAAVRKPAAATPSYTTPSYAPDAEAMVPSAPSYAPGAESGGGGSFFDQYKWPLLGGAAVLVIGGALLLRRRGDTRAPERSNPRKRAYA